MEILHNYNNLFEAYRIRKEMEAESGLIKAQAMASIAKAETGKGSALIYIIPIIAVVGIGVAYFIIKRKKK
jgi:hypothetical protein